MNKEEWKNLGYTDEQCEELARLSTMGSVGGIDAHVADKILRETMKKYELEKGKTSMSDTANLGKSLTETLREGVENFVNWTSAMTAILNNRDELKNNIDTIKELDSALTDLKKVSEETVKAATEM